MLPGTSISSKSTSSARAPVALEVTPFARMLGLRASRDPSTEKRFAPGLRGSMPMHSGWLRRTLIVSAVSMPAVSLSADHTSDRCARLRYSFQPL
ncbi:hypothetical protein B0X78_00265 [bacterium AM6]|nr:hypothetical protein B0X78_00265 [bacterium AM6]